MGQLAIATSLKNQRSFFFDEKQAQYDKSVVRAYNCTQLALHGQYLMFANGPEIIEFDDNIKSFSFTDNIRESKKCSIDNAPTQLMTFAEKEKIFKLKKNYFNNCVETFIEDEGNMPLNIKTEQPGCTVTKLSTHRAVVTGGFCFVKPNFTSTFLIKTRIKKICESEAGLKSLGLQPLDLKGNINYYSAGDDTGKSIQLTALNSIPVRIMTNSDEKFMPSSDDFGLDFPSFPKNWVDVNPYIATPDLKDKGDYLHIKPKFFVDNRCAQKCVDGLCMGECDYATPVVANFGLKAFNVKRNKFEYLTSWVDGGVAQPRFQGIVNGVGFDIPKHYVNETDSYRLEITFDDPKFDFEKFKNNIVRKFGRMEQQLPRLGRSDISKIPDINDIREQALLPLIRDINGLNFDQELNGIQSAIDTLRQYLNYKIWPPYYDGLCSADKSNCQGVQEKYIDITLDFKLRIENRKYVMTDINVVKKSIFNNSVYKNNKLPTFSCSYESGDKK